MKLLLFIVATLLCTFGFSQIVINEISTAQNKGVMDEDGDYPDWIELYNPTSSAIDLAGFTLVAENDAKKSWTFPSIIIEPNDYLIVFASEKDRRDIIDHWEVPIVPQILWHYYSDSIPVPNTWNTTSFTPSTWNIGQGGIGYGDGDDSTIIAPTTTLYMRSEFVLADTSNISIGLLIIDYDDSFVAYLNGVELDRNNVGIKGVPPLITDLAYEEHEAKIINGGNFEFYYLDAERMNLAKQQGNNVFALEIHNVDPLSDDMTSIPYFLIGVKDTSITYYPFPASTNLHTNFNLSSYPTLLKLFDNQNQLVDEVQIGKTHLNNSYGRTYDASPDWCLFEIPSPDTSNAISSCYKGYGQSPTFSLKAGFYDAPQMLTISSNQMGQIFYTLDGSTPTFFSNFYSAPISISSNTIVKAIFIPDDANFLPNKPTVATYFINENVNLPVVSITTDPVNLWDYNEGLYVFGPDADSINYPFLGANFWKGWEKECNVEYFDRKKELGFSQHAGLKIHGNFSKSWPQKSFRLLAKDDYNQSWFNYELFSEKPTRKKYKNFNIRNAGIDYNTVHFRDALMHRIAKGLYLDRMAYEPCVLFLNGEYWGVYGLRERQDDNYFEGNYPNVKKENIDLLRFEGDVLNGDNEGFREMINYLQSNDLSVQSNFDYVRDYLLDLNNVTDYFITETFYCNVDWIGQSSSNNIKFWRENEPEGKWRYVLWDTDLGLGLIFHDLLLNYDLLSDIIGPNFTGVHSILLKNLFGNTDYQNYFINRYADLLNTTFSPANTRRITRELQADLEPEMTRHFNKWNHGVINVFGTELARSSSLSDWQIQIDSMLLWTDARPQIVRDHLQGIISSPNQVDIELAVVPKEAGYIKINTIVPDSLPWTGVYFNGVPVTITAVANPGYSFEYWNSPSQLITDSLSTTFTENVPINEKFTAYFDKLFFDVQVYPNPSNDNFSVEYILEKDTQLSIKLYSVDGKLIKTILADDQLQLEGKYSLEIKSSELNLSKGVHFLVFESESFSKNIKLVLK